MCVSVYRCEVQGNRVFYVWEELMRHATNVKGRGDLRVAECVCV